MSRYFQFPTLTPLATFAEGLDEYIVIIEGTQERHRVEREEHYGMGTFANVAEENLYDDLEIRFAGKVPAARKLRERFLEVADLALDEKNIDDINGVYHAYFLFLKSVKAEIGIADTQLAPLRDEIKDAKNNVRLVQAELKKARTATKQVQKGQDTDQLLQNVKDQEQALESAEAVVREIELRNEGIEGEREAALNIFDKLRGVGLMDLHLYAKG